MGFSGRFRAERFLRPFGAERDRALLSTGSGRWRDLHPRHGGQAWLRSLATSGPTFWAAILLTVLVGCTRYEARPLDLAAHREVFAARSAGAPEVAAFAARLAEADGATASVYDPSDGLTLPEAEVVAIVFNADLRIARLRAGVSQAVADKAGLWEDPILGVDLKRIIESAPHPWTWMATVGLTIPISGRLKIERERAGAEHEAELSRVYQAEWETRTALRRAWAQWSAAERRQEVLEEFVSRLAQIVGIVDGLERAGEMARVEARLFRVESASRRAELEMARAGSAGARLEVKRLMGLAPASDVSLMPGASAGNDDEIIERARLEIEERSPALAVARAQYEVAERALQLEVREQYPDIMIGPGFEREEGVDKVVLGVALPIPLWNRNKEGVARAMAERDVARAMFEGEYERLVADLEQAAVEHSAAVRRRQIIEGEVVPMVDQQYAEARKIAELGEVDTLLLLETLMRQQEAMLSLVEVRLAEQVARVRVQELAGPPAPRAEASEAAPESRAPGDRP